LMISAGRDLPRRNRLPARKDSDLSTASIDRLAWLQGAVQSGEVHTVRASFADRLGHWRGKRIPAEHFLSNTDHAIGFCDGMLVCDVRCDIIEETPYSNYSTGYPDVNVRFDLAGLRPVGWMDGEAFVFGDPHDGDGRPSPVSPRHVLRRVLSRLEAQGIKARVGLVLAGRFMQDAESPALIPVGGLDPGDDEVGALRRLGNGLLASELPVLAIASGPEAGAFRLTLAADEPIASAEAGVVAKGAAKEIARQSGVTASFMTVQRGALDPSLLELTIELEISGTRRPTAADIRHRLAQVRALLQPSVNAFKAGAPSVPVIHAVGQGIRIGTLKASCEADPFTVTATMLAAVGVAFDAGDQRADDHAEAHDLMVAAEQLMGIGWARDWLGPEFVANAVPLLSREGGLLQSSVTDWEVSRYWNTA
jgi:glutamine synthetase